MGTLAEMDFETTRGPLVRNRTVRPGRTFPDPPTIGAPVPYTMTETFSEHFPTDGSPRTFYHVVRVKADQYRQFCAAVLPDVYEDYWEPLNDQVGLTMYPFGSPTTDDGAPFNPNQFFIRHKLIRLSPQRHPIHDNAYVVDCQVLRGNGYPSRLDVNGAKSLTFRTRGDGTLPGGGRTSGLGGHYPALDAAGEPIPGVAGEPRSQPKEGYIEVGVTWRDLPYVVELPSSELDGGDTNSVVNSVTGSELMRYCIFKPQPKGQNLQIPGAVAYFIDDDGSIIRIDDNDPASKPFIVPEAQPWFVPGSAFSVTMKMVPRVPIAAEFLKGMTNQFNNMRFPRHILEEQPDVGTLLYINYELSDPYYTVTGQRVFDITYSLGQKQSGRGVTRRGWNAAYCTKRRDFRRIVFGSLSGANIITVPYSRVITRPVTTDAVFGLDDQSPRLTIAGANPYDFVDLMNLFRFNSPYPGQLPVV